MFSSSAPANLFRTAETTPVSLHQITNLLETNSYNKAETLIHILLGSIISQDTRLLLQLYMEMTLILQKKKESFDLFLKIFKELTVIDRAEITHGIILFLRTILKDRPPKTTIEYGQKILDYLRINSELSKDDQDFISKLFSILGQAHSKLGEKDTAQKCIKDSLEIQQKLKTFEDKKAEPESKDAFSDYSDMINRIYDLQKVSITTNIMKAADHVENKNYAEAISTLDTVYMLLNSRMSSSGITEKSKYSIRLDLVSVHHVYAMCYLNQKNFTKAIKHITSALHYTANSPQFMWLYFFERGFLYLATEDVSLRAKALYNLKLAYTNSHFMVANDETMYSANRLSQILTRIINYLKPIVDEYWKNEAFADLIVCLKVCLGVAGEQLLTNEHSPYYYLAVAYQRTHQNLKARSSIDKAIKSNSHRSDYFLYRAELCLSENKDIQDLKQAQKDLEHYLTFPSPSSKHRELLKELNRLIKIEKSERLALKRLNEAKSSSETIETKEVAQDESLPVKPVKVIKQKKNKPPEKKINPEYQEMKEQKALARKKKREKSDENKLHQESIEKSRKEHEEKLQTELKNKEQELRNLYQATAKEAAKKAKSKMIDNEIKAIMPLANFELLCKLREALNVLGAALTIYGSTTFALRFNRLNRKIACRDTDIKIKGITDQNRKAVLELLNDNGFTVNEIRHNFIQLINPLNNKRIEATVILDEKKYHSFDPIDITHCSLSIKKDEYGNYYLAINGNLKLDQAINKKLMTVDLSEAKALDKATCIFMRMLKYYLLCKDILGMQVKLSSELTIVMNNDWTSPAWCEWLNTFLEGRSNVFLYNELNQLKNGKFIMPNSDQSISYMQCPQAKPIITSICRKLLKNSGVFHAKAADNMATLLCSFYAIHSASINSVIKGIINAIKFDPALHNKSMTPEVLKAKLINLRVLADAQALGSDVNKSLEAKEMTLSK